MKQINRLLSIVTIAAVLFTGCGQKNTEEKKSEDIVAHIEHIKTDIPQKGDHVSSNLVCMVNDAYMGKQQLEVPFNGKMYYGCCEMCQERIPKDEAVRFAIDPYTMKKIDKSTAYIVLISDDGGVVYFDNKKNYEAFRDKSK